MKIFIIFLNFLLITLILYSLFSCKIVEGLSECESKNSAIEKNKAVLDSMFSSMNKLELQQQQQTNNINKNKLEIQKNNALARSVVSDMENQKKEKEKELEEGANVKNVKMSGSVGGGGFSDKLRNSQGSAKI